MMTSHEIGKAMVSEDRKRRDAQDIAKNHEAKTQEIDGERATLVQPGPVAENDYREQNVEQLDAVDSRATKKNGDVKRGAAERRIESLHKAKVGDKGRREEMGPGGDELPIPGPQAFHGPARKERH